MSELSLASSILLARILGLIGRLVTLAAKDQFFPYHVFLRGCREQLAGSAKVFSLGPTAWRHRLGPHLIHIRCLPPSTRAHYIIVRSRTIGKRLAETAGKIRKRPYEVDLARKPEPNPSSFAADDESDGLTCWSGARRRAKGSSSIAHVEMSKICKSLVLARVMSGEGLRGLSDDGVGTDIWCNTNNEFVSDLITSVWIQVRKSRDDFRLPDRLRIEQTLYPWEARVVSGRALLIDIVETDTSESSRMPSVTIARSS